MSETTLDAELWEAYLGLTSDEAPPENRDFRHEGYSPFEPQGWPPIRGGPPGGVFWFRAIDGRLREPGLSPADAERKGDAFQRGLVSGDERVVAMNPDTGMVYPIPVEFWQSTGNTGRDVRWSGLYWVQTGERFPCDVYLIQPEPETAAHTNLKRRASDEQRELNKLAQLYHAALLDLYGDLEGFGTVAEIARDANLRGVTVSADTVAKYLKRGRELYDPAADMKRNPNSDLREDLKS